MPKVIYSNYSQEAFEIFNRKTLFSRRGSVLRILIEHLAESSEIFRELKSLVFKI